MSSFSFEDGRRICHIYKNTVSQRVNLNIVDEENKEIDSVNLYKDIRLNPGSEFQLTPCIEDERSVFYIYGPSGCGKTTVASNYLKEYRRLYRKRPIFLVSKKEMDPMLDDILGLRVKRIPIGPEIINDPITLLELSRKDKNEPKGLDFGCCIVFDDYETFDKQLQTCVFTLRDTVLELGRSYHITVIVISHIGCSGQKSKIVLNEATNVVYFTGSNPYQNERILKTYCGLDKKQMEKLAKSTSRWKWNHRKNPQYVITQTEAYMLNQEPTS